MRHRNVLVSHQTCIPTLLPIYLLVYLFHHIGDQTHGFCISSIPSAPIHFFKCRERESLLTTKFARRGSDSWSCCLSLLYCRGCRSEDSLFNNEWPKLMLVFGDAQETCKRVRNFILDLHGPNTLQQEP